MAAREIVIDGTDGAGKSTLVSSLVTALSHRGVKAVTQAPYRVEEVYPLWETDPVLAARTIARVMQSFRGQHPEAEVIVWDRGWPTAFVTTTSEPARALFRPYPDLTILLLNDERATLAKPQGPAAVWISDPALRERYQAAYRRLPTEMSGLTVWVFHAEPQGYFDLRTIDARVTQWLES